VLFDFNPSVLKNGGYLGVLTHDGAVHFGFG
jgi:hypothetical protein